MSKIQIILICVTCLFFVTSTVTAQKVKETMTNADVVEMVKVGSAESTIVLKIQQSEPNFDTSTKALIELTKQGVSAKIVDVILQMQSIQSAPPTKAADPNAIATKDVGSLRVVLKSIIRVNLKDQYGNSVNGIRCSFDFINLDTQRPIIVAMNAIAPDNGGSIGSYLRSTLVDENGGLWRLRNSEVAGISIVGVGFFKKEAGGGFDWNGAGQPYNPAEITTLLSKREDLNSDVLQNGLHFIYGSSTEMQAGQSLSVIMSFAEDANQKTTEMSPKVVQIATEIVVGVPKSGTKKSYTLHNLTFDRISLPKKDFIW